VWLGSANVRFMKNFHSAALSKEGQVRFPVMWEQMFCITFPCILGSKDLSVANKNVFIDCNAINLYGDPRKPRLFRNCAWDGQSWVLIPAGRRRRFYYSKTWRWALDPTQPPMQWVLGFISGVKRPGRDVEHSSLVPRSRMSGAVPPLPLLYPLCVDNDNIIFIFKSCMRNVIFSLVFITGSAMIKLWSRCVDAYILNSVADGAVWETSRPGHFTVREWVSGTHWMGDLVSLMTRQCTRNREISHTLVVNGFRLFDRRSHCVGTILTLGS